MKLAEKIRKNTMPAESAKSDKFDPSKFEKIIEKYFMEHPRGRFDVRFIGYKLERNTNKWDGARLNMPYIWQEEYVAWMTDQGFVRNFEDIKQDNYVGFQL